MAIQDIENKIMEEARLEAQKIKNTALEQAQKITDEYKEKAKQEYEVILKKAHQRAEALKKSILVPQRLEAKKAVLVAKHQIIGQVFEGLPHSKKELYLEKTAKILFS